MEGRATSEVGSAAGGEQSHTSIEAAPAITKEEAEEKLRNASLGGNADTVKELLATAHQTGLDVNAPDPNGYAALHFACDRGHEEIVIMLLATPGININFVSGHYKHSPLHLACSGKNMSILQMLLERDEIDIEAVNSPGLSPLHYACRWGYAEIARALIAAGASIHALTGDGDSLLHDASNFDRAEVVQMLVDTPGINLEARNKKGETALHAACWEIHPEVLSALLSAGANVNAIDHDGSTPLHHACRRENLAAVEVLLRYEAININARTMKRV